MPSSQERFTITDAGECASRCVISRAFAPTTTVTALPASATALVTTMCNAGRPPSFTSCFGCPRRLEAPAARTRTCRDMAVTNGWS